MPYKNVALGHTLGCEHQGQGQRRHQALRNHGHEDADSEENILPKRYAHQDSCSEKNDANPYGQEYDYPA